MQDCYVNESCSNGSCPLLVEEALYGVRGNCQDYCMEFNGCHTCFFEYSKMCDDCIYNEKGC